LESSSHLEQATGDDIQFAKGFSKEYYTLCRRGASNIKPFYDGIEQFILKMAKIN
jgi:CDGSH-type Zn-finger protein